MFSFEKKKKALILKPILMLFLFPDENSGISGPNYSNSRNSTGIPIFY